METPDGHFTQIFFSSTPSTSSPHHMVAMIFMTITVTTMSTRCGLGAVQWGLVLQQLRIGRESGLLLSSMMSSDIIITIVVIIITMTKKCFLTDCQLSGMTPQATGWADTLPMWGPPEGGRSTEHWQHKTNWKEVAQRTQPTANPLEECSSEKAQGSSEPIPCVYQPDPFPDLESISPILYILSTLLSERATQPVLH